MQTTTRVQFDRGAAITRSLLGWGVVVGPFYLLLGLAQALTREGFDFGKHPLSVLMLGEWGWVQRLNFLMSAIMTLAAAVGFMRAMGRRTAGFLVAAYGICLALSGIFAPDPMAWFPPGAPIGHISIGGILHMAFGAIGFFLLAAACFSVASWYSRRGDVAFTAPSRLAGGAVIAGFVGGAVLSTHTAGIAALWAAVVVGWTWLAACSVRLYRSAPKACASVSFAIPDQDD
jgi:hypothetical protein